MSEQSPLPKRVGLVGLGLLGRGIAASLLGNGFEVIAYSKDREHVESAGEHIDAALQELVARAGFPAHIAGARKSAYREATSLRDLADCEFVIESVTENSSVKSEVYGELEAVLAPSVAIATNTSALPITSLQRTLRTPSRLIGMHWAEPAHATRFLEIIRGEMTSNETFDATLRLAKAVGKDSAIVNKDIEGFIANRLGYAMYREAFNLLEQGVADAETIDRSFRNSVGLWASIAGPFRWMDLTGPAGYAAAMRTILPTLSNTTSVPAMLQDLAARGARGVTGGSGFYEYSPAQQRRWLELFRSHVWAVRELQMRYFPPDET
jgi:3-hydroxybutyryl-CoA dehydrogenase